jgi:hypothetical protein
VSVKTPSHYFLVGGPIGGVSVDFTRRMNG